MKQTKTILIFVVIGVLVFGGVFLGLNLTRNIGKSNNQIGTENAENKLEQLKNKINVTNVESRKVPVELEENLKEELPDISTFPLSVENTTDFFIEIFSSTEKATKDTETDNWLGKVAEEFNNSNITINGEPASVSIRPIASGVAADYIASGKYVPDLFSPSNEFWGKMIESSGVKATLEEKVLIPNVAGILLSKKKHDELLSKYGTINMKTITEATSNSEISMGYTNPFASSTGLNFLVSTLCTFDAKNPLSNDAIAGFEAFQSNVPFVAYTTLQMRESAKTGVLDGFIMEYQTYINNVDLRSSYIFTPFGTRHDSPVYSFNLSDDKKELTKAFIEFCKQKKYQDLGEEYGFKYPENYVSELPELDGDTLVQAQKLWKEKKDNGKPIVAVFVADISGSMSGEPINELKRSLLNGSKYINSNNYVGLVTYSTDVYVNLPISKFDINNRSLFAGAVTDLNTKGSTATFDAVVVATDMLKKFMKDNPDTKPMLFVLSDGETNIGSTLNDTKDIFETFGIPIYTIGYNADIAALKQISEINEAANINATSDDVVYQLKNLFNAQM
jgi:Ca-activated chloride channel family protein